MEYFWSDSFAHNVASATLGMTILLFLVSFLASDQLDEDVLKKMTPIFLTILVSACSAIIFWFIKSMSTQSLVFDDNFFIKAAASIGVLALLLLLGGLAYQLSKRKRSLILVDLLQSLVLPIFFIWYIGAVYLIIYYAPSYFLNTWEDILDGFSFYWSEKDFIGVLMTLLLSLVTGFISVLVVFVIVLFFAMPLVFGKFAIEALLETCRPLTLAKLNNIRTDKLIRKHQ